MVTFADRLSTRTRELGHPLCLGLDPYLERIPEMFRGRNEPATVRSFLLAVLELARERVAIVKPQISLFERMGIGGLEVLAELIEQARSHGLLVLLDAKRGDIGHTAMGYAQAYLSPNGFLDVDAVTVSPYMGRDAIEPFVEVAAAHGRGVVVLVRNSNPGADRFQTLSIDGRPLFEVVACSLAGFEARLMGGEGWSSLAVTTSALAPDDSIRIRRCLPHALFLVLGYGAQGGGARGAVAGLERTPAGYEGGVVNSSRGVLYPPGAISARGSDWEMALSAALSRAIHDLQGV